MTSPVGVLMVALRPPTPEDLDRVRAALSGESAELSLAHLRPLGASEAELAGRVETLHDLAHAAGAHGPAFRRGLRGAPPAERLSLHLSHDPFIAEHLAGTVVLVGLDPPSAKAVRRLAAGRADQAVSDVAGLAETVRRVANRRTATAATSSHGRSRPTGKLARTLLHTPGLSDRRRAAIARDVALTHLREGRLHDAEQVAATAARIRDLRERADLLGDVTSLALHLGHATRLARETYAAELAVADELLDRASPDAAAAFAEALRTAFHPVLHMHHTSSPLAGDPEGFTAPLAHSRTARRFRSSPERPRERSGKDQGGHRPAPGEPRAEQGRPIRVLLLTRGNANFLGQLRDHLGRHRDFEVRLVDAASAAPELNRYSRDVAALAERILREPSDLAGEVRSHLGTDLAWADVVWVEWCTVLAVLVSRAMPERTRLVIRLHSYEAFTGWPHLVDFRAVDDLLLVSDHLRELCVAAIPALREPGAPRTGVLPLGLQLRGFDRPKADHARHTVALVGWHKVVKDPLWALEVIRLLRRHDERYRLHLVGDEFDGAVSAATRAYADQLHGELEELEAHGGVVRRGRTEDVPAALQEVGVIVSSSVRESFHAGLVEGAASGAVPVVRDWPYFAGRSHSARTLFPADWVVRTPAEAAERIIALTADEATWRAAGAAAADHVISTWDWEVVQAGYEAFLRGRQ